MIREDHRLEEAWRQHPPPLGVNPNDLGDGLIALKDSGPRERRGDSRGVPLVREPP